MTQVDAPTRHRDLHPPDDPLPIRQSAAALQRVVPDAVLVGGTTALAGHRISFDHDHVLALRERYEAVPEAVEATAGWATSVRASKPPMTIMDEALRVYLDVAALADRAGLPAAAAVLDRIDSYYVDRSGDAESVVTALAPRLRRPVCVTGGPWTSCPGTRVCCRGGRTGARPCGCAGNSLS